MAATVPLWQVFAAFFGGAYAGIALFALLIAARAALSRRV